VKSLGPDADIHRASESIEENFRWSENEYMQLQDKTVLKIV
jgi:hypothetical protein